MDCKGENKSNQKYWKSDFSEEQLTQLFDAFGKDIKEPKGGLVKFLKASNFGDGSFKAGYTYLGQFLAHEMTLNLNTLSDLKSPSVSNARTPRLDLDSVYGKGPLLEPLYYNHNSRRGRVYLSLQESDECNGKKLDFTRIIQGKNNEIAVPVIPDVRNDENIMVAHIHLSIILFHNKMVDEMIEVLLDKLIEAVRLENDTKVNLSNQVFVDFLVDKQRFGKNYEGERILWEFVGVLMKSEVNEDEEVKEAPSHISFHAVDPSERETAPASNDFNIQIQALSTDLAQFLLASPVFYFQAVNEDPEKEIQLAQSKINTILDKIFILAKRETVWHFQWLILTDFLPKIVGTKMMNSILSNFSQFKDCSSVPIKSVRQYKYRELSCEPFEKLPPIFTGAFFRFGHYLVLDRYKFRFVGEDKQMERNIITLKRSLTPMEFNIKLSAFFGDEAENASSFNMLVNSIMTEKVSDSKQNHNNNIVVRNLRQTAKMSLPSGQYFAETELDDENLKILTSKEEKVKEKLDSRFANLHLLAKSFPKNLHWKENNSNYSFNDFLDHSPPWFYMALEAYILAEGKHLGPVAGRVVAEVIVKILESDPTSILGSGNLKSRPAKVIEKENEYTEERKKKLAKNKEEELEEFVPYNMVDFLRFTNTYDFEKEEENKEPNKEGQ